MNTVVTNKDLTEHILATEKNLQAAEAGWKEAVNRHGKTLQRAYRAEATIKRLEEKLDDFSRHLLGW